MSPLSIENSGDTLTLLKTSVARVTDARGVAQPIVLRNGFGQAELNVACDTFAGYKTAQQALDSDLLWAIHDRDVRRGNCVDRMVEFTGLARAFHTRLPIAAVSTVLRASYGKRSKLSLLVQVGGTIVQEWQKIAAITDADVPHPFLLSGGYTLERFIEDLAALQASGDAVIAARSAARSNRILRRQFIENVIRPRLVEYRALIKGLYPRNHEFVLSLPRANPLPGSTPAG
ncbi:MAG: hypothetical protein SFY80_06755, partial [Verrucomicrobiota bacterium]|nr:hypothetical protein [Verrucomicrobiota bacterium]